MPAPHVDVAIRPNHAVLYTGCALGLALLGFGLLGLNLTFTDPTIHNKTRSLVGAIAFIALGALLTVACVVALVRRRQASMADDLAVLAQWVVRQTPESPLQQSTEMRRGKVRLLASIATWTLPLLERDEKVAVSLYGVDRRRTSWTLPAFGWVAYLSAASELRAYFVTVTDRRVIALIGTELTQRPDGLAFEVPRTAISAADYRPGFLQDRFGIARAGGDYLMLSVIRMWRAEAILAQRLLSTSRLN